MNKRLFLCLGTVVCLGAATGFGQVNTGEGAHVPGHGRVNKVNTGETAVDALLADGSQSGQLTADQSAGFKRRLNQIQSEKTNAMVRHHGHLTKEETKDLKQKEEELERDIQAALKKA